MQALRAGWSEEAIERAATQHGERFPLVDFIAESEQCPICGSPMMKFTNKFVCSDRKCGHETGQEKKTGLRTGRKSKKDFQQDKRLLHQYGKQKKQKEETLGDLFDF